MTDGRGGAHPPEFSPDSSAEAPNAAELRGGDLSVFEAFVKRHYPVLTAFAYRITQSRATAEDVVQDVFFRLWQRRTELPDDTEIVPYVFGAMRRRAIDVVRQTVAADARAERFGRDADVVVAMNVGEADLVESELQMAFDRVVAGLPPRCREIFVLNRVEGLSYADVAQRLGVSVHTVHVQMGRALKRMHALLKEWRSDDSEKK